MRTIYIYLLSFIVFLLLDGIWLGYITPEFYQEQLGEVIDMSVRPAAAGIFYLCYIAGIMYFIILPALADQQANQALWRGALLGGLCYATYDMTNWATIAGWPGIVVIVDVLWGMFITGMTSFIVVKTVLKWFTK